MRVLQSSLFRALCSIAVGVLLVKYPSDTVTGLTVAIGILFFVSGTISCIAYLLARRHADGISVSDASGNVVRPAAPTFPLVGIGSLILGLLLALSPAVFVTGLMYILGLILILGAVGQYMSLLSVRRIAHAPWVLWVCPTLVLLTGLYVLIKPMESASLPLVILGWCSMVYGVSEMINALKLHALRKAWERQAQQAPTLAEERDGQSPS